MIDTYCVGLNQFMAYEVCEKDPETKEILSKEVRESDEVLTLIGEQAYPQLPEDVRREIAEALKEYNIDD